ncbi:MAG: hypothetical protein PHT94_02560 [Candidatus Nanoarchaeia archaeon]|nr:hypothetical protein [Candidatus Nanoarchaeia archaeon]
MKIIKNNKKCLFFLMFTLFILININLSFVSSFSDNYYDIFKCDKDGDGFYKIYDINDHESCEIIDSNTKSFSLDYFDLDSVLKNNITLINGRFFNETNIDSFNNVKNLSSYYDNITEFIGIIIELIETEKSTQEHSNKPYFFLENSNEITDATTDKTTNDKIFEELLIESGKEPITIKLLRNSPYIVPRLCLIETNEEIFQFEGNSLNENDETKENKIYKIEKWTATNYEKCNENVSSRDNFLEKEFYLFCKNPFQNYIEKTYENNEAKDLVNCYVTNNKNIKSDITNTETSEILENENSTNENETNTETNNETNIIDIFSTTNKLQEINTRIDDFSNTILIKNQQTIELTNTITQKENVKTDLKNKIDSEISKETNATKKIILEQTKEIIENNNIVETKTNLEIKSIENLTKISIKIDSELEGNKEDFKIIQNIDKSFIDSASKIIYNKTKYSLTILIDDPLIMWNFLNEEELQKREIEYYVDEEIESSNQEEMEVVVINTNEPLSTPIEEDITTNETINENINNESITIEENTTINEIINENINNNSINNNTNKEDINEQKNTSTTNHNEENTNEHIKEINPEIIDEKENLISIILGLSLIPTIIFLLVFFEKFKKKKEEHYEGVFQNEPQTQYFQNINQATQNNNLKINDQQRQKLYDAINKLNK